MLNDQIRVLPPISDEELFLPHPNPNYMAVSKFLRSTREQVERFQDVKRYSKKLMAFKVELSKAGLQTTFNMYEILNVRVRCPINHFEVMAQLREYNSQDVLLSSHHIPFTILFEDCFTGLELVERMKQSKLIVL